MSWAKNRSHWRIGRKVCSCTWWLRFPYKYSVWPLIENVSFFEIEVLGNMYSTFESLAEKNVKFRGTSLSYWSPSTYPFYVRHCVRHRGPRTESCIAPVFMELTFRTEKAAAHPSTYIWLALPRIFSFIFSFIFLL